jgi:prepilin-type N-terminal cleavage/methylation domain-containing protein
MRGTDKRVRQQGFTLIEIMIALVILSVGLAGLIPMSVHSVRGNTFGETTTIAATWSQDKLEELRRLDFTHPDLAPSATVHTDPPDPELNLTRGWKITDICGGCGDIVAIEVCTAKTGATEFDAKCFSASPVASYHFMGVRASF